MSSEQTDAAAERSAHVTRDQAGALADTRPFWWVIVRDAKGGLLRVWHTRMAADPTGATVEFTRAAPEGRTPA